MSQTRRIASWLGVIILAAVAGQAQAEDKMLFDFEEEAGLKDWSNLDINPILVKEWEAATQAALAASKPGPKKAATQPAEPAVKMELVSDGATSGKKAMKLTFAGGNWPAVTTSKIAIPSDDWQGFLTLKADVTVQRPCLVGFRVMQEKSRRAATYEANVSRYEKTCLLPAGRTAVVAPIHTINNGAVNPKWGDVVAFEIYMYRPHEGESIIVDNIRLGEEAPPAEQPTKFEVLGTDMKVGSVGELHNKLKDKWTPPTDKPLAQIQEELAGQLAELRKKHPKAVLAVFRQGDKGFDPAKPEEVYKGWSDAYVNSHGPDGNTLSIANNTSQKETLETFMRHRSQLIRIDVSSIPKGSEILSAKFVIIRSPGDGRDPSKAATMWVAEACNRPWVENEVNGYEYARDKFWKSTAGWSSAVSYAGDDPDFWPVYLAYGPSQGKVNVWDFTEAVKFWTDGKKPNCGFFFHGDSTDYIMAWSSKAKDVASRPALMVIYEPK